jgi:hypothetical protein
MSTVANTEVVNDVNPAAGASWNPLRCTGTDLPINLTVMVKVLAIALLLTNHVRLLPDPWLSFIPPIDLIPGLAFKRAIQVVFIVSALAIVFNRRTRISSVVLGSTMLLAVVSSKAYYGNNKTFCGLMLLLAGLYKPGGPPFIRWQLALTYFGAGLNKLLDRDWQTGIFFEYWSVQRLHEHAYIALDSLLPRLWLGRLMCWFTIVTELGVVPFLLLPGLYYWGALANILFQCGLLLFVGNTFTMFFYGMSSASFAFVDWPSRPMRVLYDPNEGFLRVVHRFLIWIDVDRQYLWTAFTSISGSDALETARLPLKLVTEKKTYTGYRALRMILLYNPVTYIVLVAALASAGYEEGPYLYRRILIGSALVFLLPPLAWCADRFMARRAVA